MNLSLLLLIGFAVLLLILLGWLLRDPRQSRRTPADVSVADETGRRHATYFPQVRRALAPEDFAFLRSRGAPELVRIVRNERRRVALAYLASLRSDFLRLWHLARMIASMSPKVGIAQEVARLRLGLVFSMRYELIRIKLLFGFAPLAELGSLSDVVSRLAIRLETAMKDLGERAAMAAKLASTLDGRGFDTP